MTTQKGDYLEFSPAQQLVLQALCDTTDSILLTGVAGCGKSTLLRYWLNGSETREAPAGVLVLAPTGVAALNVGGSTIHRAFGFYPNADPEDPRISLKTKSLLHGVTTIVIDEVSMVRADLLGAMDIVLRSVKRVRKPFGGVRMVMVGDFYQLPPVVKQEEERWLEHSHGSRAGWCFFAPCFQELEPRVFYLADSFRSRGDKQYTDILNGIRKLDPNAVNAVNEIARNGFYAEDSIPRLCARKKDVQTRNEHGLRKTGSPIYMLEPVVEGDRSKVPSEELTAVALAEGARVMCTRNGAGYVNGSIGTLKSFDALAETWDGKTVSAIEVVLDSGLTVCVPQGTSEVIGYEPDTQNPDPQKRNKPVKTVLASVHQYELALAYAWTIHKSQGQTLEKACIDLGSGAFAHGQTYVALSRLTGSAGLYLNAPLKKSDLALDPDVVTYFEQYQL